MFATITATAAAALPAWQVVLLVAPAFAALTAVVAGRRSATTHAAWRWARAATVAMLVAAGLAAIARMVSVDRADLLVRSDTIGVAMLILVSFVGWVVVRFSQAYLAGDPQEPRYLRLLLLTLATVATVVIANHLVLLVAAWAATSLALHGLLTFFGDRPVAVAVAHKKFILARCADVAMSGAVIAFATAYGTMRIDRIATEATAAAHLPTGARIGIALVGLAALLKCAQLPFHGWLIQVMEAPTPVSALLHAGVVNLGGFVLLRFAPLVDRAVETRALLVAVGTVTAVCAALVATTRISVKVSLAWSTCAQMGFMLMQCGLGLWEMALLHLLAHSLYKAHAFLGAGGAVRRTQRKQLVPKPEAPAATSLAIGVAVAGAGTAVAGWLVQQVPSTEAPSITLWVLGAIVALALVPLTSGTVKQRARPGRIAVVVAVALAYFALHEVFGRLVPHGSPPPLGLVLLVALAFALLFMLQALGTLSPNHPVPRRLHPWIYGGLFLDEAFTRAAFALWPPPSPQRRTGPLPQRRAMAVMPSAISIPSGPAPTPVAATEPCSNGSLV